MVAGVWLPIVAGPDRTQMERVDRFADEGSGRMSYVDGFVLAVPKKNLSDYRRLAKQAGKIWREHGALEYVECVGDDLDVKFGVPFTRAVKIKPGETVVFSWITYKSKAHRDRVNAKVMKDQRLTDMVTNPMPFDMKRMVCGGFKVLVKA